MRIKQTPEGARGEVIAARWVKWVAFTLGDEVFKWLAWSTAIAALLVAEERLDLPWLFLLIAPLFGLLLIRIQSFINVQHPEEWHENGSKTVTFTKGRLLLGLVVTLFAWSFAVGLSNAIAQSNLLPREPAQPQSSEPKALKAPTKPPTKSGEA